MVLLACVGAVLLVACANVANLLLARASTRQREFAVGPRSARRAAGWRASCSRKASFLSLVGGALGILVAQWLVAALITFAASTLPRIADIAIDGRVLLYSLVLSGVTGLIFGLWPALQVSTTNPFDTLKDSTRAVTGSVQGARLRSGLVVAELAIALVLLVTAALFVRSFSRLYAVDPASPPTAYWRQRLWMPQPNDPKTGPYFVHEKRVALINRPRDRILALPGVESAGWSSRLPFTTAGASQPFWIEGRPIEMATPAPSSRRWRRRGTSKHSASPCAAAATSPTTTTPASGGVDRQRVPGHEILPGEDPIGKRIRPGNAQSTAAWFTIVGVVADVRSVSLERARVPQMYRAAYQFSSLAMALVVKTKDSDAGRGRSRRCAPRSVRSIPPAAVFGETDGQFPRRQPLAAAVRDDAGWRVRPLRTGAGVGRRLRRARVSGDAADPRNRCPDGARRRAGNGGRMVIMEGGRLAAIGLVHRPRRRRLSRRGRSRRSCSASAPTIRCPYLAIVALLAGVSLLACIIPARRAMRIDPLTALRED
jgi:putative ABC transport system permease protein